MRMYLAGAVTMACTTTSTFAQAAQQTFDSNMANANRMHAEEQAAQSNRSATENGTSQYNGAKPYSSGASGTPMMGYQRSTE